MKQSRFDWSLNKKIKISKFEVRKNQIKSVEFRPQTETPATNNSMYRMKKSTIDWSFKIDIKNEIS